MPVDYQVPMDARIAAPPAYAQAAPQPAYAGNEAAQRFMAEQAGRAYGQTGTATATAVVPVQYTPAVPSYAQPGYPAPSFQAPGYTPAPAAPQYQQPAYQAPVQSYPQAQYQAPTYQAPAYQAPQYAQPAPAYRSPQYQQAAPAQQAYAAPQYQAPAYQPVNPQAAYQQQPMMQQPAYQAQAETYPNYAYQQPAYQPQPVYQAQPTYQPQVTYQAPSAAAPSTRRTRAVARAQARRSAKAARAPARMAQPRYAQVQAPAQAYPTPSYTQPVYAQEAYPQLGYGQVPAQPYAYGQQPAPNYAPPAPAYVPQSYGAPATTAPFQGTSYGGDPEMDRINNEIASLSADGAPGAEGAVGFRYRDGESGLGQLNEVSGRAAISTGVGPGRVELSVSPVYIDSGTPSGQALSRFGTNPLLQAQAVAGNFTPQLRAAPNQDDAGVAVRLGYETGDLTADVGTTPMGMGDTDFQGGVRWSPRLSSSLSARVFAERRPVTDSVLAYAGTVDPLSGVEWGQVIRTGGGGGISVDAGRGVGVYADVNGYSYEGRNVRDNGSVEINVGGYLAAWQRDTSRVTIGANVNYQHYDNNQNFFSFGHGGYFSPQRYIAVSFPIRYRSVRGPLSLDLTATPGFQSYRQDGESVFPTSDPLQAELLRLRAANPAVLANYGSITESGFGLALQGAAWYRVNPGTAIGAEGRFNTFGAYNEAQALLRVRQSLGALR